MQGLDAGDARRALQETVGLHPVTADVRKVLLDVDRASHDTAVAHAESNRAKPQRPKVDDHVGERVARIVRARPKMKRVPRVAV